jgi:hypothetical protein
LETSWTIAIAATSGVVSNVNGSWQSLKVQENSQNIQINSSVEGYRFNLHSTLRQFVITVFTAMACRLPTP